MRWSELPFHPPAKTLRLFAASCLLFLGTLASWHFAHERPIWAAVCAGLAATIGPLGLAFPSRVRPVFVVLLVITFPIGWCISLLALGVVFYGLFTPLGLIFKLAGRDLLSRRLQPEADTYWTKKGQAEDIRSYFRQS